MSILMYKRQIIKQDKEDEGQVTRLTCKCPWCGRIQEIAVRTEDLIRWDKGALIQDALPYLTKSQREALITGICDPCWDTLREPEDEGEDNKGD